MWQLWVPSMSRLGVTHYSSVYKLVATRRSLQIHHLGTVPRRGCFQLLNGLNPLLSGIYLDTRHNRSAIISVYVRECALSKRVFLSDVSLHPVLHNNALFTHRPLKHKRSGV